MVEGGPIDPGNPAPFEVVEFDATVGQKRVGVPGVVGIVGVEGDRFASRQAPPAEIAEGSAQSSRTRFSSSRFWKSA